MNPHSSEGKRSLNKTMNNTVNTTAQYVPLTEQQKAVCEAEMMAWTEKMNEHLAANQPEWAAIDAKWIKSYADRIAYGVKI